MTTMTIRKRRTFAELDALAAAKSVEEIIVEINAGHRMAGMPLTDDDIAVIRRIDAGETTTEEELRRLLHELTDQARDATN